MPEVDDIASFVLLVLLIAMFIALYMVLSAYRRRLRGEETVYYDADKTVEQGAESTADAERRA